MYSSLLLSFLFGKNHLSFSNFIYSYFSNRSYHSKLKIINCFQCLAIIWLNKVKKMYNSNIGNYLFFVFIGDSITWILNFCINVNLYSIYFLFYNIIDKNFFLIRKKFFQIYFFLFYIIYYFSFFIFFLLSNS